MEQYQQIYNEFISGYSRGEVSPSQVGEILAKLAGLFPNYNMTKIATEKIYAAKCKEEILRVDDQTAKAVSASKSQVLADASQEAADFRAAKGHVENIEMQIGVLKFLQKALETEYLSSNI